MHQSLLLFIGGVLTKTTLTLVHDFKKKDIAGVAVAVLAALYVYVRFIDLLTIQEVVFFTSTTFIAIIAFTLKDKILPNITEGTLLLYGLISLYLFETLFKSEVLYPTVIEWTIIVYCLTIFVLCLVRVRIRSFFQIFLFTCFLLLSLVIMSSFVQYGNFAIFYDDRITTIPTSLSMFFTGFAFFQLLCNLLFVLYFIPLPLSKNESFRTRISNIKRHARDLERKYIDRDIGFDKTIFILLIGLSLPLNHYFDLVNDTALISIALIIGEVLASSRNTTKVGALG